MAPEKNKPIIWLGYELEQQLSQQPLQLDQPVWVCKTKGYKSKAKKEINLQQQQQRQQQSLSVEEDPRNNEKKKEFFLRARIVSLSDENQSDGRITVQYPKGSTYRVRPSNLKPILVTAANTCTILVWPETDVYRRCCIQHTGPDDYFCEIGCDHGATVAKVAETLRYPSEQALGVDKATLSIDMSRSRYPHLHFVQWDILAEEMPEEMGGTMNGEHANESSNDVPNHVWSWFQLQRRQPQSQLDGQPSLVVAVDINGNRLLQAVQECVEKVQALWQPRLIIVKSRAWHEQLASSIVKGSQSC